MVTAGGGDGEIEQNPLLVRLRRAAEDHLAALVSDDFDDEWWCDWWVVPRPNSPPGQSVRMVRSF